MENQLLRDFLCCTGRKCGQRQCITSYIATEQRIPWPSCVNSKRNSKRLLCFSPCFPPSPWQAGKGRSSCGTHRTAAGTQSPHLYGCQRMWLKSRRGAAEATPLQLKFYIFASAGAFCDARTIGNGLISRKASVLIYHMACLSEQGQKSKRNNRDKSNDHHRYNQYSHKGNRLFG